jgi:hypothetical protein
MSQKSLTAVEDCIAVDEGNTELLPSITRLENATAEYAGRFNTYANKRLRKTPDCENCQNFKHR